MVPWRAAAEQARVGRGAHRPASQIATLRTIRTRGALDGLVPRDLPHPSKRWLGCSVPQGATRELLSLPPEHTSGHAAASRVSRAFFASTPPTYWPSEPSLRTTRWQGTTTGMGLVAHAVPTARTAFGLPVATAMAA